MAPFIWTTVLLGAYFGLKHHTQQQRKVTSNDDPRSINAIRSINTHEEHNLAKIKANRPKSPINRRKLSTQSQDNTPSPEASANLMYSKSKSLNSKEPISEDRKEIILQDKKETISENKKETSPEYKNEILESKIERSNEIRIPDLWRCRACHQVNDPKYNECKLCGIQRPDTPEDLCQWPKITCNKPSVWLPPDENGGKRLSAYCQKHAKCDVTQLYNIDDLPVRFLNAENGDSELGFKRWIETSEWRKRNKLDAMLDRPHPNYDLMKKNLGIFYHGFDRDGDPIYIEIPALHNIQVLKELGFTMFDMAHHYIFLTEFLWQVIAPADNATDFCIIDIHDISIKDFYGDAQQFLRMISGILGKHYPERTKKMFIINAPWSFGIIWKIVKSFLDPVTASKIDIYYDDSYKKKLREYVDPQNIPAMYGGSCNCLSPSGKKADCILYSQQETMMRNHCHWINETSQEEIRELAIE